MFLNAVQSVGTHHGWTEAQIMRTVEMKLKDKAREYYGALLPIERPSTMDQMKNWFRSVEWSYTWNEIPYPPKVIPKGVLITTSAKKIKLFGSSETSKTILLRDHQLKEDMCMKIEHLRHTQ
ncbi:hypothetical protein JTB14_028841 [Gonioctena quinquepunctata]|nr:hypothetical protein JTB14_028841 [Gonioctena quinquepunctata]